MPLEWAPVLGLVGTLLRVAFEVISLAKNAKRYKRKCALLQHRVEVIVQHLKDLERAQCTPDPPAMRDTLAGLRHVLNRSQDLVQSCQRKKKPLDFLKARKNTGEFTFLNERITILMESFHVANRTLIMGMYSDQIFMVVLRMLLQSEASIEVLQHNRAVVQKCINEFPYDVNNMTPEKKQVMDQIERILALAPPWQRDAAANYEQEISEVKNIAEYIVSKAKEVNQNREAVQRVAQLARHVLFFLPNLRFPQLTRHADTQGHLDELNSELHAVAKTIESSSRLTSTSNSWKEQAKVISKHGNNIDRCFQSLTLIALSELIKKTGTNVQVSQI